jgi:hypothetical protein
LLYFCGAVTFSFSGGAVVQLIQAGAAMKMPPTCKKFEAAHV